jgi:hypothetical protein
MTEQSTSPGVEPVEPVIHQVFSVAATFEPNVYNLDIDLTDAYGLRYRAGFCSRPDDPYGLGPRVREWLSDNPDFPIAPYVPPTIEQVRENMSDLGRLDFKSKFKAAGMNAAKINAYLASLDGNESHQEDMQMYYDETPSFSRVSLFVTELSAFSGKTPAQIDTIWAAN